jgi:hypothetical protein
MRVARAAEQNRVVDEQLGSVGAVLCMADGAGQSVAVAGEAPF